MRNQRGFTLVEIMIALVIMLIVSAATYKLLITTQRVSRAQAERSSMQANVRSGSLIVPNELRELNNWVGGTADRIDITSNPLLANSIKYRAMRGFGIVCDGVSPTVIRIHGVSADIRSYSGYRDPKINKDGAYVFHEGPDALHAIDDGWDLRTITVVSTATACTAGGPGITLTLNAALPATPPVGTPVRIFEEMELKLYVDGAGDSWLGAKSVSTPGDVTQPVLGPLAADSGFALRYFNAAGAITAVRDQVASIEVTVRGLSDQAIDTTTVGGRMSNIQERLATRVFLRNSVRP